MEEEMKILFEKYILLYKELQELYQGDLPRSIRVYNIRLRLALDIEIDFKGEVSLTNKPIVKETYVLLIKLMEIWNAYEGLAHFIQEDTDISPIKNASMDRKYSIELLEKVESLSILKNTLERLKTKCIEDGNFKEDFEILLKRIYNNPAIKTMLSNSCQNIVEFLEEDKEISGMELLSLIYAERNMYYHNGETVKMGMGYRNRKYLLSEITKSFYLHVLLLTNYVIKEQIEKISIL